MIDDVALLLGQYGLLMLGLVVFIKQVGLPLPSIPLLVGAGALAGTGRMSLWSVFGITVVAALAADWVWFELGRRRGRPVLGWLCRIALEPDSCVGKTESFFTRHGPRALVAAKFVPGLSTIAPPLAGIVGLSLLGFLWYDSVGAVLWAGSGLGLGYVFSDRLEEAWGYADGVTPVAVTAVGMTLLVYVVVKAIHRGRERQTSPRMSARELRARLIADQPPVVVDVRAGMAHTPGIPGARRIPVLELPHRHGELPHDRDLVLYCDCPRDVASIEAALMLRKLGFQRLWVLAGGVGAWQAMESESQPPEAPELSGADSASEGGRHAIAERIAVPRASVAPRHLEV